MKTRIITAFLIIACVIPPLVFGGVLLYALLSFIIVAGGLELMALREQKDETWPLLIKPLAIACVFALTFIKRCLIISFVRNLCPLLFIPSCFY